MVRITEDREGRPTIKFIMEVGVLMELPEDYNFKNEEDVCQFFTNNSVKEIWDQSCECLVQSWKFCERPDISFTISNK